MSLNQVCVISTQHVAFWENVSAQVGNDVFFPFQIGNAQVGEEIIPAIPSDYTGWVLLDFSWSDAIEEIAYKTHESNIQSAIADTVDRYVERTLTVQQSYPNIAVWGPVASPNTRHPNATIGNVLERNFVILLLTEELRKGFAAKAIPFISIAEEMIAPEGKSSQEYFNEDEQLSLIAVAFALRALDTVLNLKLASRIQDFSFIERRIETFDSIGYTVNNGFRSLQFTLSESVRFITKIFIPFTVFSRVGMLTIGSSIDEKHYSYVPYSIETTPRIDKYYCMAQLNVYAKTVVFQAAFSFVTADDLDIFAKLSPLSDASHCPKATLLSLRDRHAILSS